MRNTVLSIILAFVVAGCSTIKTDVADKLLDYTGTDLTRTSEMAAAYNKPEVKRCADFMLVQVAKIQSADSNLAKLRNEPTAGLLSASLKAALIAEALRSLESVNGPAFKADFKAACSEVAGDILFNVMQDAAKFRGR